VPKSILTIMVRRNGSEFTARGISKDETLFREATFTNLHELIKHVLSQYTTHYDVILVRDDVIPHH
jgi:hypothetical protein